MIHDIFYTQLVSLKTSMNREVKDSDYLTCRCLIE